MMLIPRRTFLGGAAAAAGLAVLPGASLSRSRTVLSKLYVPPFLSDDPMIWDVRLKADHERNVFHVYLLDGERGVGAVVKLPLDPIRQIMGTWHLPVAADLEIRGQDRRHPERLKVAFQKNSPGPHGGDFALWPRVVGEGQWTVWLVTRDIAKTLAI